MTLTNEQRVELLNRAIHLESRSFLEYIAHTAPPFDIHKFPGVAHGFAELAHDEDEIVDELVEVMLEHGAHPDALGTYDLGYPSYNYITTDYALRVLGEKMKKNLAEFDRILTDARGDELEGDLRPVRERKAGHVSRLEQLREDLKSGKAAAPVEPAGGGHDPHAPAAHH